MSRSESRHSFTRSHCCEYSGSPWDHVMPFVVAVVLMRRWLVMPLVLIPSPASAWRSGRASRTRRACRSRWPGQSPKTPTSAHLLCIGDSCIWIHTSLICAGLRRTSALCPKQKVDKDHCDRKAPNDKCRLVLLDIVARLSRCLFRCGCLISQRMSFPTS